MLLEVTNQSYYKWYAKSGSRKLTVGFLVHCTYKVRIYIIYSPKTEAIN